MAKAVDPNTGESMEKWLALSKEIYDATNGIDDYDNAEARAQHNAILKEKVDCCDKIGWV